jgi:Carboxypeptidase regulatory-like domain
MNWRRMMAGAVLYCALSSTMTFAQSSNAAVGGFVQDPSQAYIPGVTVTATNTQTGVSVSAVTNESGAYNIPSLLPGKYKISAELPGFRTQVFNNVELGANIAARYNFVLAVGAAAETVEVTAEQTALIAESSPTIGQVLTENKVRDLPLVSNNVLDLMKTMPGVQGGIYSATTTFAGISASAVNTTRDGLSVQEGRYAYGVGSTTLINPDMVGEFRVILAPVDAETGRGNGQVQITTRSGTNQFRGAASWNIRNSALDANTWVNNKQVVRGVWTPALSNWQNDNEYSISLGGPIKRNKTFFFFLWDQNIERDRTQMRPVVLTDCARNGIFRYWDFYQNGNLNTLTSGLTTANPVIQSVDSFGNPLRPATNPNGTPYTGQLRYFSVFGQLANTPTKPDCSDAAVVPGTSWDSNRTGMDPTGFSQKYISYMAHPNVFDGGDGLNTAIYQWQFGAHGTGDLATAYGTSFVADHHQENLKVDHLFNPRHKIAVNGSYQVIPNDYIPVSGPTVQWPNGYLSKTLRKPRVLTANLTSTLTASLLNEARFGYRANWHYVWAPWEVPDVSARQVPLSLLLNGQQGFPIAHSAATIASTVTGGGTLTTVSFTCSTGCAQQGNYTPLFEYADTLSYTHGKHAFKAGADIRISYTKGYETPTAPIPKAFGGAGNNANLKFSNNPGMPNLVANNQTVANSLLYFLSGSLDHAQMYYHIYSSSNPQWNSFLDHARKLTWAHQNDWSAFLKDDWKVRPSFTLNLGVRYEFYGVPYENRGLTPATVGGGIAMLGVSGRSFDQWLRTPSGPVDTSLSSQIELVGPNSPNPSRGLYRDSWKNFGPAVGFSWELPWFGKEKTNVRGGYQITYAKPGNLANLVNNIFLNPGFSNLAQTSGPLDGSYFDLRNLSPLVPIAPATQPLQPLPFTKPNQAMYAFDSNFKTPYIQNLTLSVTRNVSRNVTVDVRYIGTRGLKLDGSVDLNSPNVFYNPKLFNALETTRRGGDDPLFDQMFLGLNLNPGVAGCDKANPAALCGAVNGTTQTGSQALRLNSTFRASLANGDYATLAGLINTYNGIGSGASGTVNFGVSGERGTVLKRANQGFNVPGGNSGSNIPAGTVVQAGLFPANWIAANPQVSSANFYNNSGKSNYHSLQLQTTLRATQGLTFQGTYVWSRSLALSSSTWTNPADRDPDYNLAPTHVTHDFRANGTYALPIGRDGLLFSKAPSWVGRLIEGWQTSFIINMTSGTPTSISAGNTLYANGVPDIVGPFPVKSFGKVQWNGNAGSYFGSKFNAIADPQCNQIAAELKPYCTIQALTDAQSGQILLQNPQPGKRGSLGQKTIEMPGTWAYDGALTKAIRLTESKRLQLRVDATDVLNHPNMGTPNLNLTSTNPFGSIQAKGTQHRQFKALLRLDF